MNTMHLIGAEQVQSAGASISRAADTISSAASTIDSTAHRLASSLEQHGYQMGALAEALAGAPSLRDQMAMAALQGFLTTAGAPSLNGLQGYEDITAKASYKMADAMLKARET